MELSGHYGYRRIAVAMFPSILMILITSVYCIVDGFFVANYVGATPFAAVNLIWPALMFIAAFGSLFGIGGTALVSKTLGQRELRMADEIFSLLCFLVVAIGVVLSVAYMCLLPTVIGWLGAEGELAHQCQVYGFVLLMGMPAYMLQQFFQPFYMTAGKPQMGTFMTIASGVGNMVLDAVLIILCGWGLSGAAIATVVSFLIGGCYPLWYFSSSRNTSRLHLVRFRFSWRDVRQVCFNGLSDYVDRISFYVISVCYNLQLMKYIGEAGVTAFGIIMYLSYAFAAYFIGYNLCISPIIGYNYGAQNLGELRSLLRKSLVLITAGGVAMTLLGELTSPILAGIFVGYDAQLKELTIHAIRLNMLCFSFAGINMFVSSWFTSLNNGVVSAIVAFLHTMVFELGAILLLPLVLGVDGIWLAVNVADTACLAVSIGVLCFFRKRYHY